MQPRRTSSFSSCRCFITLTFLDSADLISSCPQILAQLYTFLWNGPSSKWKLLGQEERWIHRIMGSVHVALSVIAVTCLSSYLSDGENLFAENLFHWAGFWSQKHLGHAMMFMFMFPSYVSGFYEYLNHISYSSLHLEIAKEFHK